VPHPDEEPIFRRVDLSPPSVPATTPQEEPILKYMEPRGRTGARSTYGGRRRAPDSRGPTSAPPAAPVTPSPVTSAPATGGRRRRYRDDDEPATSTGAIPTSTGPIPTSTGPIPTSTGPVPTGPGRRHAAEPDHAADARHAQPAAYAAPRHGSEYPEYHDYPETPGYTDPNGRSARYPIAEPTYVPGRPYDTDSRHAADQDQYAEPAAYVGGTGYATAPPYGEAPYSEAPYPDSPYGDVPRAGGFPYNEDAAYGAPARPETPIRPEAIRPEAPVRPRRPDVSESAGDGMRTVRPDTTGGLPRLTTTSSGGIPRITTTTGNIPRIGSSTSGTLPRISPTTTGSLRPVRIDPVRPAPRRTSKWMVALASVGVVVLLAVCGLSTYFVFQDELTGSKNGGSSNANATNAPPAPRDIRSREVDPEPLTEAEVFPADSVAGAAGATYQVLKKEAVTDCPKAATDDLANLLVTGGCSQVVRGTMKSADGAYLITAGVFNLTDETAAFNTHENINAIVAAQKGRFTGLLAGAGTEVLVRAPMILGWHARGHYLAYCVIARADGQGFEQDDKAYTQIQADILTNHLRDVVIGARTVPKGSGPAAGASVPPSPSTS
jgi:hypothetical protein